MHDGAVELNRHVDIAANLCARATNADNFGSCPRKRLDRGRLGYRPYIAVLSIANTEPVSRSASVMGTPSMTISVKS